MSATIARGTLGNASIQTGAFQTNIDLLTDMVRQIAGGSAAQALEISAGVATPADGQSLFLALDTEASAATDDLDTIALTNVPDGSLIFVQGTADGRDITVKDGTGNLVTSDGNDFILLNTKMMWVGRVGGSTITEIFRSYGDQVSAFRTFLGLGTAAVLNSGTGGSDLPTVNDILGKNTIWVPARAMEPQTTNGCAPHQVIEITANQPEAIVLDFDDTTQEYAFFSVVFPKAWNKGTVTAKFYYIHNAAVTTTTAWSIQGVSRNNNEALATAYGTAVTVTDSYTGSANELAITAETAAVTIGGTPATDELVYFRVSRNVASDSTTGDLRLIGVRLVYTENALNDD